MTSYDDLGHRLKECIQLLIPDAVSKYVGLQYTGFILHQDSTLTQSTILCCVTVALSVRLSCLSVCLSVTCQYCVRITEPVVKQSDLGESPCSRILTVLTAYCLLLYFPFYFSGA